MSDLYSLGKSDFIKAGLMVFITTATTSIATAIITILNQLINALQAGMMTFDWKGIFVSVVTSIIAGILMGVVAAINYLVKNFFTEKTSAGVEFLGGSYKL